MFRLIINNRRTRWFDQSEWTIESFKQFLKDMNIIEYEMEFK